jgi:hypothetical protein
MGRRVAVGVGSVALLMMLTGCSPDNVTGVGLTSEGVPTLKNCGELIRGVTVTDATSGRVVWAAGKPDHASEFGVADVQVGAIPDEEWVEEASLAPEPRPAVWRFAIRSRNGASQTIDVVDRDLKAGGLLVPGKAAPVTEETFRHDVCGERSGLVAGGASRVALGLVVVLGVGVGRS